MAQVPFALQDRLIEAGASLDAAGWTPATSGNLSLRADAETVAVTATGRHLGRLQRGDFVLVDLQGRPRAPAPRPSAEALLHARVCARDPDIGAVLHVHSRQATLISRRFADRVVLEGFELLKALRGVRTHEARVEVPIVDNDQDMPRLAAVADAALDAVSGPCFAYLIRGHGIYAWGHDLTEARRHLDALDFLFDLVLTEAALGPAPETR